MSAVTAPSPDHSWAATSSRTGLSGPLASHSKYLPPALPRHWIRRDRLNRLLAAATRHPMTVVTGPSGAGKSVLLADFTSGLEVGNVSWLALEPSDNDCCSFWTNVAISLGIDLDTADQPNYRRIFPSNESMAHRVAKEVATGVSGVLVLDNIHHLTDPSVTEAVLHLANHLPREIRLLAVGHTVPHLTFERLLTQRQSPAVRGEDLRFTTAESSALLTLVAGRVLPAEQVAALTERTAGSGSRIFEAGTDLAWTTEDFERLPRLSFEPGQIDNRAGGENMRSARHAHPHSAVRPSETPQSRGRESVRSGYRMEFLRAVQADRLADLDGVLRHCKQLNRRPPDLPIDRPPDAHAAEAFGTDSAIALAAPKLVARAHAWLCQPEAALAALTEVFETEQAAEVGEPATLAILACRRGRLRAAYRLAVLALEAKGSARPSASRALDARMSLAEVLYEHDELDAAGEQLTSALQISRATGYTPWTWAVEAELVKVTVAKGHPEQALEHVGRLRHAERRNPLPEHLVRRLCNAELLCHIALGDLGGTLTIARSIPVEHVSARSQLGSNSCPAIRIGP